MDEAIFPIDVFPRSIQRIIQETHDTYSFPINYISASILVATSIVTGNSVALRWKNGWNVKSNLFVALVGQPGAIKSHPIKFALRPLIEYDRKSIEAHNKSIKESATGAASESVVAKQYIVKDITMEALAQVLSGNPRGVGVHKDELKGWFSSFDSYRNKGSDTENWLSLYDGDPITINRKGSQEVVNVAEPFVSVIGGIQPNVLKRLFCGNLSENGFFHRILYVNDDCDGNPALWNDGETDSNNQWNEIVAQLKKQSEVKRSIVPSVDMRRLINNWQNRKETDICKLGKGYEIEAFRKIQNIALKMCILIHILHEVTGEIQESNIISEEVAQKSILIAEFFYANALDLYRYINLENNSSAKLQEAIKQMPATFKSHEFIELGLRLGCSGTTTKQFLRDMTGNIKLKK